MGTLILGMRELLLGAPTQDQRMLVWLRPLDRRANSVGRQRLMVMAGEAGKEATGKRD